jgi:hypothetical protein
MNVTSTIKTPIKRIKTYKIVLLGQFDAKNEGIKILIDQEPKHLSPMEKEFKRLFKPDNFSVAVDPYQIQIKDVYASFSLWNIGFMTPNWKDYCNGVDFLVIFDHPSKITNEWIQKCNCPYVYVTFPHQLKDELVSFVKMN